MERVQDGGRVGQCIADGVGVAAERVQGGVLDGHGDLDALLCEPVREHPP